MARLNQPADPSHTTPVVNRASNVTSARSPVMSSPSLLPLTSAAGLQSHGTDNLPPSAPRRSSGESAFSPTDCRTLEKLLRNTGVSSPLQTPQTPSPPEPGARLFPEPLQSSDTSPAKETGCYASVGGEATDTGYEDEDDSMELSEGAEGATGGLVNPLEDRTSPSISRSGRRLQDSVSTHDEKDRLRYNGRRSSTTKQPETKRQDVSEEKANGDTIEDVMNLPGLRASPAHPLNVGRSRTHKQPALDNVQPPNKLRLHEEKALEDERAEQERTEDEEQLNVSFASPNASQNKAKGGDDIDLDGFDADMEDTTVEVMRPQRRKDSQSNASNLASQTSSSLSPHRSKNDALLLVPNSPTPTTQTPERAQIQSVTNQNVCETPFTKTLGYYKHLQGTENSPSKRRRNTALPQDIAEVTELAVSDHVVMASAHQEQSSLPIRDESDLPAASALADLEEMMHLENIKHMTDLSQSTCKIEPKKNTSAIDLSVQNPAYSVLTEVTATEDNSQKQLTLYPRHPPFVNAIGMIPATMFWVTAAPVVKYSGMAVELLIDKLRDTYL